MIRAHRFPPLGLVLAVCLSAGAHATAHGDQPAWPEVTTTAKPWSRWWWLGNILNEADTTAVMEQYAAAGLGGLEITPIYGVAGYEDRFLPFLSPAWMKQYRHVVAEARRLGLGLDMATGTGWPFGGPWIDGEDACRYLAHRKWSLAGGARLAEPVELVQEPVVRAVGSQLYEFHGPVYASATDSTHGTMQRPAERPGAARVRLEDLVEPVTANRDLQSLALDQVRFPRKLPLVALMASADSGEVVDLTSRVDAAGTLDWTAPAGRWTLHGLFGGWHGKMVERAAPGGEGNVIDHFSSRALATYLRRFEEVFTPDDFKGLRAFYNDSYEVDDAQGESDWTPGFLAEFERRRGYDLRRHLPALLATAESDEVRRVRSDYRETLSDLLLDEFTVPWREWANRHGSRVRNQAHGSPANIIDLYAASDIPEQEGTDILAIKLASSAAHLTGKQLVSSEAATWLDEHFSSTLADLRRSIDTYLLGGLNHNCYHGTAYSPPSDPWPGFHFYASVELNPSNPIWADFGALNAYVTRAQSFLQSGQPDEGILLYYNIHDRWAQPGGVRGDHLPHFHGRAPEGIGARDVAERLHAAGYGFDYVSDRLIAGLTVNDAYLNTPSDRPTLPDGPISSGRQAYSVLVVPATNFMPVETLEKLVSLAERGATVIFEKQLPADVPGLGNLAERRRRRQQALSPIRHAGEDFALPFVARVGRGRIIVAPDAVPAIAPAGTGARREGLPVHGVSYVRRRDEHGHFYFIVNRSAHPIDGWLPFSANGPATIYDPMTGRIGRAANGSRGGHHDNSVYLQLAPGESRIVRFHPGLPQADLPAWPYARSAGPATPLVRGWTITIQKGGPTLPPPAAVPTLKSWTEFGSDELKAFSGTARYTLSFPNVARVSRPVGSAPADTGLETRATPAHYLLDLGAVADSARVYLNGREIAALIAPPWQVLIPATDLRDENILEVDVTNLAANRIADLDRRGVPWKKFYNVNMPARRPENRDAHGLFTAARWSPRPSGLLGPVTLTPLETFFPQ